MTSQSPSFKQTTQLNSTNEAQTFAQEGKTLQRLRNDIRNEYMMEGRRSRCCDYYPPRSCTDSCCVRSVTASWRLFHPQVHTYCSQLLCRLKTFTYGCMCLLDTNEIGPASFSLVCDFDASAGNLTLGLTHAGHVVFHLTHPAPLYLLLLLLSWQSTWLAM